MNWEDCLRCLIMCLCKFMRAEMVMRVMRNSDKAPAKIQQTTTTKQTYMSGLDKSK